jgi:S-formylglutathione hydrolase
LKCVLIIFSAVLNFRMRFAVYVPDNLEGPAPVLYQLGGMSCSEQSFIQKTGFQRWASHYGIIVVSPDVCPSKDRYLIYYNK